MSNIPDLVDYRRDAAVVTLTMQRPGARNALNRALRSELLAAFQRAEDEEGVRVIVLQAAGEVFCAGNDLREPYSPPHETVEQLILQEYQPLLDLVARSSRLVIAAVQGTAAGIGLSLALNCDLVWMREDAQLYAAFAPIGLVPDGGATWHMVQALGYHRALQWFIEGQRLSAAECLLHGLANAVCPSEGFVEAVQDKARQLAELAPLAVQHTKQLARRACTASAQDIVREEATRQVSTISSEDCRTAVEAFFTGRKPVFRGL